MPTIAPASAPFEIQLFVVVVVALPLELNSKNESAENGLLIAEH